MNITSLHVREVLDSRGNPTVAVRATLADGTTAEAMVPSGVSTGTHEALELRDNDTQRYGGKGVLKALANVHEKIFPALAAVDALDQRAIDSAMLTLDGTENKSSLGANAILGVSLAVARAAAQHKGVPLYRHIREAFALPYTSYELPVPMMNIINGGAHADSGLDIQEYMIVPQQSTMAERVRVGSEIFHALKKLLKEQGHSTAVGDEGGFAPHLGENEAGLMVIADAVKAAGYTLGTDVKTALDVAASEFYREGMYTFDKEQYPADEIMHILRGWIDPFQLVSIEDPLAEDDWAGWQQATAMVGERVMIVGDDLFVTNPKRLQQGIDQNVANAILVKVNQIGTLTETIDTILLARKHNYKVIVSHRSGETEDTFIADLAVAVNAEYIKTGSLSRSDRVSKYNRLMAIEEEL